MDEQNTFNPQEKCRLWQERLRLLDWNISAKVVPLREMDGNESGHVKWWLTEKIANIKLIEPADYPKDALSPYDVEETLVHELLHLHIAPFDNTKEGSLEGIALEQAINAIASSLIKLARRCDT